MLKRTGVGSLGLVVCLAVAAASCRGANGREAGRVTEVRIPKGAGGVGFLPLLVMERHGLIEKHSAAAGLDNVRVRWIELGGPAVVNDALLSGSADFIAAGPPAFLTLWDRTQNSSIQVLGVAAMTSLPMYLNTGARHLRTLDDLTDQDKIGVTAPKVSIPAIIMQMYARQKHGPAETTRYDKYTVSMTHPDGVIAMLSGSGAISAHFTSPPFHQRERRDPAIRTILNSDTVMGGPTTFTMVSTTGQFREANPKLYTAVVQALGEATAMIVADRREAAEILLQSSSADGGFTIDEIVEVLNDPDITFTTTPERVMKYAEFMHDVGSITHLPASWKDLFFPEIHDAPGS
jgi:NitT/TauT family transport system substrate-binding protein